MDIKSVCKESRKKFLNYSDKELAEYKRYLKQDDYFDPNYFKRIKAKSKDTF